MCLTQVASYFFSFGSFVLELIIGRIITIVKAIKPDDHMHVVAIFMLAKSTKFHRQKMPLLGT